MKKIIYISVLLLGINVSAQVQKENKESKKTDNLPVSGFVEAAPLDSKPEEDAIYHMAGLEVKPSFPGSFQSEVQKRINPTDNGAPSPFNGRVYVNFIIEKDGSLSNVRYTRDPGYGFGNEVKEAVEKVQIKWNPGFQDGKPVRVTYTLPVEIKVP